MSETIALFEGVEIVLSGEGALAALDRIRGGNYEVEVNGGLTRLRIKTKTHIYLVKYDYHTPMVTKIEKAEIEIVWSRNS